MQPNVHVSSMQQHLPAMYQHASKNASTFKNAELTTPCFLSVLLRSRHAGGVVQLAPAVQLTLSARPLACLQECANILPVQGLQESPSHSIELAPVV
jgi:hypothetical protein